MVMMCGICEHPQDDYVGMHPKEEECPQCKNLYPKVKKWFADNTDADLDLVISMGKISKEWAIRQYIKENN